jgi:hypothetical protein
MVENCCGGDTLMPAVFQRTLGSVPREDWNFSAWVPDALVINLVRSAAALARTCPAHGVDQGTNDNPVGRGIQVGGCGAAPALRADPRRAST